MAKYSIEDVSLSAIGNVIREKTKDAELIPLEEMPDKVGKVYDAGKQSAYDEFWDSYQQNGNRTEYSYAFAWGVWSDNILKPKYTIKPTNANNMFHCNDTITDLRDFFDKVDWSKNTRLDAICRDCTSLKYVGKLSMIADSSTSMEAMFHRCTNLISIDELYISPKATSFTFTFSGCKSLTDITITGTIARDFDMAYSPLNKTSMTSVINALSGSGTGRTLYLNKTAKEAAFTDEEWATLIANKPNWTISLIAV